MFAVGPRWTQVAIVVPQVPFEILLGHFEPFWEHVATMWDQFGGILEPWKYSSMIRDPWTWAGRIPEGIINTINIIHICIYDRVLP